MMNQHHQETNLYEIPNCSICLVEMTQDLSALDCGHVFHLGCLRQHLEYRGTCPNCQKRSHRQELKPVFFPLVKNTQSAMMMRQILGSISSQQRNQVQELFQKLKLANEKIEKLEYELKQSEKHLKSQKSQLNRTKTEYNLTKHELQSLKKDIICLRQVIQNLQIQIKRARQENFDLDQKVQDYKEKQSEYEKYKIIKRKATESSQALIFYKQQLQAKQTPDKQIARIFFDMIMIKNLEVIKLKNEKEVFPQTINYKQEEISQLKHKLQKEKRQVKDLQQKQVLSKKKYDQLKVKYRNLAEKFKTKCQEALSEEDNYQDSMLSRPSFPLFTPSNVVSKANGNYSNTVKQQNIPMNQNKVAKKNSSSFFNSILEEEEIKEGSKVIQNKNKPSQQSLNNFVTQKNNMVNPFGSFGGILNKKKPEEKKVGGMKNIFSN